MTDDSATGFALYQAHPAVVRYAVRRVGLAPWHPEYQDYVEEGMLLYVAYYRHYGRPVATPAAVAKFNRLAGKMVYLGLLQHRMKWRRRVALEQAQRLQPAVAQTADLEVQAHLAALLTRLTPQEQAVLRLRLAEGLTNQEIAGTLHISPQRVRQLRRGIQHKHAQLPPLH